MPASPRARRPLPSQSLTISMLLGMYYNGFILIAIFLGHTFGYLVFGRDTLVPEQLVESGCCC